MSPPRSPPRREEALVALLAVVKDALDVVQLLGEHCAADGVVSGHRVVRRSPNLYPTRGARGGRRVRRCSTSRVRSCDSSHARSYNCGVPTRHTTPVRSGPTPVRSVPTGSRYARPTPVPWNYTEPASRFQSAVNTVSRGRKPGSYRAIVDLRSTNTAVRSVPGSTVTPTPVPDLYAGCSAEYRAAALAKGERKVTNTVDTDRSGTESRTYTQIRHNQRAARKSWSAVIAASSTAKNDTVPTGSTSYLDDVIQSHTRVQTYAPVTPDRSRSPAGVPACGCGRQPCYYYC